MAAKNKTFKVYGNEVKISRKKLHDEGLTYVVDIFLNESITESFDSEEEAEEISEKWARKTFFYLCDEGLIDENVKVANAQVNITVKRNC